MLKIVNFIEAIKKFLKDHLNETTTKLGLFILIFVGIIWIIKAFTSQIIIVGLAIGVLNILYPETLISKIGKWIKKKVSKWLKP